jgi:Trypsin-like peptidase domain
MPEDRSTFPELGSPTHRFTMPLVAKIDDKICPMGTGFMINPSGLMVTACHVLEAAHNLGVRRMGAKGFYHHYELYACYSNSEIESESGNLFGGLLPINNVWAPLDIDIGFGWLTLPVHKVTGEPIPTQVAVLRAQIPSIGDTVTALGYLKMEGSAQARGEAIDMRLQWETAIVSAKVVEVFPEYRDRGLLKYPCFRVDSDFPHGMSGGPIFDETGNVCGVVSVGTSWDGGAWGSLVWPLFGSEIELTSKSSGLEKTLIYDLAVNGSVSIDISFNRVKVQRLPNGNRTVTYLGGNKRQRPS